MRGEDLRRWLTLSRDDDQEVAGHARSRLLRHGRPRLHGLVLILVAVVVATIVLVQI